MSVKRLKHITKIGVEQMGDLANSLNDSKVLRLENLDTDLRPPKEAIEFTKNAVSDDNANSYLPFFGFDNLRQTVTKLVGKQSGHKYNWKTESLISAGGLSGILNVLLATIEEGDEVIMTDPTYVGLINRVRLAGGVPIFISLLPTQDGWRLDTEALNRIENKNVKMALIMSPSMPTGCVLNNNEWNAITKFCKNADCWLLYDSAMERILFDNLNVIHPATYSNMRENVITVGSASKEYRMIGWRVGWIVGPEQIITDIARVSISNVVCQTGIAMGAVEKAILAEDDGIVSSVKIWEERRNLILEELSEYVIIKPEGGWSLLIDVSKLGMDGQTASELLLEKSKIAATPMINWGSKKSSDYIRLVYSNEPLARLKGLRKRFDKALKNKI